VGRNIVRVRATVTGMKLNDPVWFLPVDVDDPSDRSYPNAPDKYREYIDPNGEAGNDNHGRLTDDALNPAASVDVGKGESKDGAGRLRAVNALNEIGNGKFGGAGKAVKALVKWRTNELGQHVDKDNSPTDDETKKVLVAEVDFATTYAPGDNFRVLAYFAPDNNGPEFGEAVDKEFPKYMQVPTRGDVTRAAGLDAIGGAIADIFISRVAATEQLAVWRYLNIEDDSAAPLQKYLTPASITTPASTNRQSNRFADAFLEPKYITLLNRTPPNTGGIFVHPTTGDLGANQEAFILAGRGSAHVETPTFWVVYTTDTFSVVNQRPIPGSSLPAHTTTRGGQLDGFTLNQNSKAKYQASVILTTDIMHPLSIWTPLGAAKQTEAAEKTAVHEIAHQLLAPGGDGADNNGHRGTVLHINALGLWITANLLRAHEANAEWVKAKNVFLANIYGGLENVNLMNEAAVSVPAGNQPGLDVFYLHPLDIMDIRLRRKSP